ncbi:uncharacterized protein FIBRA_05436 [Fibroporia radiculosa]|uniref:DUF6533 domain-containing protein n=1 Tax=Fibroporia radiculosa TaxID=599839 RepID=J4G9E3_9APHY|nr:uncharacterized protein FIBRA_05436 [Fibroporia radiculosa]CCM03308.1 predicted protein [Fibroporia radiculosa]
MLSAEAQITQLAQIDPYLVPIIRYILSVNNRFAVAATCFLVYDTLVHIPDEIEFIWIGQQTWTKWAYGFIRHIPYIAQGTILFLVTESASGYVWRPDQCRSWIVYQLTVNEALTIIVEAVLIVRVYAMFRRNVILRALVLILFVAEITAMITVLALSIPNMEFTTRCIIVHAPSLFPSYWIFSLVFETILFGLTLYKFFTSMSTHHHSGSILYVLARDGTWAYAVIFMIMLTNTLMYHLIDNPLAGLCFFWELSVISSAGAHVLLNLRRLAVQDRQTKRSYWATGNSETIEFSSQMTGGFDLHAVTEDPGERLDVELDEMRIQDVA